MPVVRRVRLQQHLIAADEHSDGDRAHAVGLRQLSGVGADRPLVTRQARRQGLERHPQRVDGLVVGVQGEGEERPRRGDERIIPRHVAQQRNRARRVADVPERAGELDRRLRAEGGFEAARERGAVERHRGILFAERVVQRRPLVVDARGARLRGADRLLEEGTGGIRVAEVDVTPERIERIPGVSVPRPFGGGVEQCAHARLQRDERRVSQLGAGEHVEAPQGGPGVAERAGEQVRHEGGCLELADPPGLARFPSGLGDTAASGGDDDGLPAGGVGARPFAARVEERYGREPRLFEEFAGAGLERVLAGVDQPAGQLDDRPGGADPELLENQHAGRGGERDDRDGVALLEHVPVRLRPVGEAVGVVPNARVSVEHRGAAEELPVRDASVVHGIDPRTAARVVPSRRAQSPRIFRIFSTRAPMSRSSPRPVGS